MMTIFRDGGYSMFFILAFGMIALVTAGIYAARGKKRPLGFVFGMMAATLFSTAQGICSDLGTTFKFVSGDKIEPSQMFRILIEGAGESMAPGIMGFILLALTSILLAAGAARAQSTEGSHGAP